MLNDELHDAIKNREKKRTGKDKPLLATVVLTNTLMKVHINIRL